MCITSHIVHVVILRAEALICYGNICLHVKNKNVCTLGALIDPYFLLRASLDICTEHTASAHITPASF